ncbi:hypothetical protein HY061_03505 [Candidatus Azambacteria bacterium]|nr:hypothetical protein [Candidatus Azambacteria bacterium]
MSYSRPTKGDSYLDLKITKLLDGTVVEYAFVTKCPVCPDFLKENMVTNGHTAPTEIFLN